MVGLGIPYPCPWESQTDTRSPQQPQETQVQPSRMDPCAKPQCPPLAELDNEAGKRAITTAQINMAPVSQLR